MEALKKPIHIPVFLLHPFEFAMPPILEITK